MSGAPSRPATGARPLAATAIELPGPGGRSMLPARPRVSIAAMLSIVVVVALGLAAIRSASPAWAGALTSLTFFLLIVSWLGIAFRRGDDRAFWVGFALLGWSYILLTH